MPERQGERAHATANTQIHFLHRSIRKLQLILVVVILVANTTDYLSKRYIGSIARSKLPDPPLTGSIYFGPNMA
jgi:hypothetical protein